MLLSQCQLVVSEAGKPDRRFPLGDQFTIGRDEKSDLVLNDRLVSRHHCILILDDCGRHFVQDGHASTGRASRNGIYINGSKERVTITRLKSGDVISISATTQAKYLCAHDTDGDRGTYSGEQNG